MEVCGRGHEDDRIPYAPHGRKKKIEKGIDTSDKVEWEMKYECPVEREFEDVCGGVGSEGV